MMMSREIKTDGVPAAERLPQYTAEDLTKGGNMAQILLGDQVYFLRITRAGKLILTK